MSKNSPGEVNCPSCGRFVGPVDRCAYCGAAMTHRFSLRAIKYASLFIAVAGLVLLYLAARGIKPRHVKVKELRPDMNRAYVQVEGRVAGEPRFSESGSLGFNLDDGTGKIRIWIDEDAARELQEMGKLPNENGTVSIVGYLTYKKDRGWSINVEAAENCSTTQAIKEGAIVRIKDVSNEMVNQVIQVEGVLGKIDRKSKGVIVFEIEDDGHTLDVKVMEESFGDIVAKLEASGAGTRLQVRGKVGDYKGQLQLQPRGPADVTVLQQK